MEQAITNFDVKKLAVIVPARMAVNVPMFSQPPGQVREREDRLIGQVARLLHSGDQRSRRTRTCADGRFGESQRPAPHVDRVRSGEATLPDKDIHPQLLVAMDRIIVTNTRPKPAHTRHRRPEVIYDAVGDMQPKFGRVAHFRPGTRGPDHALGRDTADVEAIAAHEMPFDEGDLGAQRRGHSRRY
jgi:hypothetical protein